MAWKVTAWKVGKAKGAKGRYFEQTSFSEVEAWQTAHRLVDTGPFAGASIERVAPTPFGIGAIGVKYRIGGK